ncbi:penicillin acylase family protein [Algivirga pacifica]|uniref:Penicillin acylase family protein n=1 Tax=Algivirga pacifica TaxID=1162670 RepID=A0ABP9DD31_9BACT
MKYYLGLMSSLLSIGLIAVLNTKIGVVPPLGKFLDPFNGFWQNAKEKNIAVDENIAHQQLKGKGTVLYDSLLIPHIYAENDLDAYFLQGYVTASNRLWQMELQTHAAAGRLSEILGKNEKVLGMDREMRRKGMGFGAENFLRQLKKNPEALAVTEAYRNGINAYINSLSYADLPIEYKLLDYRPEPWTLLKSAYLLKYMAESLSSWDADFEYSNALALLGRNTFDLLYPDMLKMQDPIVNGTTPWDFQIAAAQKPNNVTPLLTHKKDLNTKPDPDNGSNNWAVSGARTQSGHPMLANDPHLGLNAPSIWYEIHITSPEQNVMGASLPGAPGVISGFNENIAWGVTNARRDVVDWYKVTFKDSTKNEYLLDGKWVKAEKRIETIKVRGEEAFIDTVTYTQWGPVMYDETFGTHKEKQNYAMRWVAHDPTEEVVAIYHLNRAKNYADYRNAIKYFSCPAQNFVFAANDGDIALTVQGRFPLKWEEQGKFVMDGSRSDMAWQGFIPAEHNIYTRNPERGFVSSANQHPVDDSYPYYHFDAHYEYYRNRRINDQLGQMQNANHETIEGLLNDNYNLMAKEALEVIIKYIPEEALNGHEKIALQSLKDWDHFNDAKKIAPVYFEQWWRILYPMIWDEMAKDQDISYIKPNKTVTIKLMAEQPNLSLFDIQETPEKETVQDVVLKSFQQAVKEVNDWKGKQEGEKDWAAFKSTTVQHLSRVLKPFNITGIRNGGNRGVVNATSEKHGPSWRMIVELDPKGTKAWAAYPGGQSGNPGSPFYDQQINRWEACDLYPLDFMSKQAIQEGNIDGQHILSKISFDKQ